MSALHSLYPLALFAALLSSGCAAPVKPQGAELARRELIALRADAKLAPQVQAALLDAELAVQAAELPTRDSVVGQHAVHVAQRKVAIARADAERRIAEAQLKVLEQQRADILKEAQSREVEIARSQAEAAAMAAIAQQRAAGLAEAQAAESRAASEALRQELEALNARLTARGLVMTLGDVLFDTARAELKLGATERLDRLAAFLTRYRDRSLLIEGHTDAQGTDERNLLLSERRAEAVRIHLLLQGIEAGRMSTAGRGSSAPLTDNITAEGRQQNRRVEIIISAP